MGEQKELGMENSGEGLSWRFGGQSRGGGNRSVQRRNSWWWPLSRARGQEVGGAVLPTCSRAPVILGFCEWDRQRREKDWAGKREGNAARGETVPGGSLGRWREGKSQPVWHSSWCHNLKVNSVEKEEEKRGRGWCWKDYLHRMALNPSHPCAALHGLFSWRDVL